MRLKQTKITNFNGDMLIFMKYINSLDLKMFTQSIFCSYWFFNFFLDSYSVQYGPLNNTCTSEVNSEGYLFLLHEEIAFDKMEKLI